MSLRRMWRMLRLVALLLLLSAVLLAAVLLNSFFFSRHHLTASGMERAYHLYVPPGYDASQPAPLLLVYHMQGGLGWLMQEISGFNALAAQEGFIVAYPDGYGRSWADGSGLYEADRAGVDDVGFTDALIDHLAQQYTIDPEKVYAVGFSGGGFMALRLACELSARLAAVAAVSAAMAEPVQESCLPARSVPVMIMHGTADERLPLDGHQGIVSIPEAVLTWVGLYGCDFVPVVEALDQAADGTDVRREMYVGCREDARVWYYAIDGGGHRWPGSRSIWQMGLPGRATHDISASAEIWAFFDS